LIRCKEGPPVDRNRTTPRKADDALGQLILDHCHATGDTLAGIAKRGGMSRQTLSSIVHRTGPITIPRQVTLAKLATGMGVSLHTVEVAAAMSVASDADTPEATKAFQLSVLIGYAQTLNGRDLEVLMATARALASADSGGLVA